MNEKKKTLTQAQYLQLTGLLVIAARQRRLIEECLLSALEITGETEGIGGHTSDAIWTDDIDADELLKRLGITVQPLRRVVGFVQVQEGAVDAG